MQGDMERCLAAGMDDYLTKPIDPQRLSQVLDQWLFEHVQSVVTAINDEHVVVQESVNEPHEVVDPVDPEEDESTELIFDHAGMSQRLMGDDSIVRLIAEAFLEDAVKQIGKLQSAIGANDVDQCRRHAHTIKGAAANVGGIILSACAASMENSGKAGDIEAIIEAMPNLERQFTLLKAEMKAKVF